MKIGIWLDERFVPTVGGGASYTNMLLNLIDNYQFSDGIEICYVTIVHKDNFKREVIDISQIPKFVYKLFERSINITNLIRRIDKKIVRVRKLKNVLRGTNIGLMYYIQQMIVLDPLFPFISTNWDIGHRSTFPFPELNDNNIFEYREYFYQSILPKAIMIICESETGKRELMNYTRIGEHKIRIMPIFAGDVSTLSVSDERMKELLLQKGIHKNHYFYYPAQFWAHKNHIGLVRAFKKFISEVDSDFKLVFSGSDKGNCQYVKSVVTKLGLSDRVLFLGFISKEEVFTLYCNATCLVMASHFGPTNMPPLEALEIGCPVACSNLGGHREELGDSAVYFNSFDDNSIYNALKEIVQNRDIYVDKIKEQRFKSIFNTKHAIACLDKILSEVVNIRQNWGE